MSREKKGNQKPFFFQTVEVEMKLPNCYLKKIYIYILAIERVKESYAKYLFQIINDFLINYST